MRPLAEPNPALDQLKLLLLSEAERFRRNTSVSMAVVVSVNERTELLVHFTQRNGRVHASARCERGDTQDLASLWPALRQALAPRRVELAPLRGGFENRFSVGTPSFTSNHAQRQRRKRGNPGRRPDWDTWA